MKFKHHGHKSSTRIRRIGQLLLIGALIFANILLPAAQVALAAQPTPQEASPAADAPVVVELINSRVAAAAASAPVAPLADQANLVITIVAASPNVIVPGGQIQYNVSVTNSGPSAAQNVLVALNITYPVYANIVGGSAPGGWGCATAVGQRTRTCTRSGDLSSGATELLTFMLDPQAVGLFRGDYFQASVTTSSEDPDTSNNVAYPGDVTVTSSLTSADVVADYGSFDPNTPAPTGSLVTMRWAGRNAGPGTTAHTATLTSNAETRIMGVYEYEYDCANNDATAICAHSSSGPNPNPDTSAPIYALLLAPGMPGDYDQQFAINGGLSDPLPSNNNKAVTLKVEDAPSNADLEVVTAETGPASVAPGATVFYSLTVRNNGPDDANKVVVFAPLFPDSNPELGPGNTQGSIPLAPNGWDCKGYVWGRGWYCTAPTMKDNEEATLLFRFSAPPNANIYTDNPGVGSATGDPNTSNNIGQAVLTVNKSSAPVANLRLKLEHATGQTPLLSGDQAKLLFRTINDGPDSGETGYVGVSWDFYGDKWEYVSHSAPAGWDCTLRPGYDGGMDCFKSDVPSGADDAWTVVLQAPKVAQLTDMRACVLTTSATRNNTAVYYNSAAHKFACDTYYVTPHQANLRITGRDNPDPVNAGGVLSYTLVVHNDGPAAVNASYFRTLELKVDPGVTFQRFGGDGWTPIITYPPTFQFYFPPIAAGASTTATIVVAAPSVLGGIAATATVRGPDYDVDLSNNELVLRTRVSLGEQAADLGINLAAPQGLCVGETRTVTATANSFGPDPAINPTVVITAPAGLTLQSASSSDFLCSIDSASSATCTRGSMGVGSSTIVFSVQGVAGGSASVQASVSSETPDDNQADNSTSATSQVNACPRPTPGKIAYIFNGEPMAADYETLLEGRGYTVDLIGLTVITSTNLSGYDLFILGDDSGRYPGDSEWFTWGTAQATTASQMAPIIAANKPLIGLGEGGSIYLEKRGLSIGWLNAWYRTGDDDLNRAPLAPAAIFASPNAIPADPVKVYNANSASVNVYGLNISPSAFAIGTEIPDGQHYSISGESCHFGWGFRHGPTDMTADGKNLFHNLVEYAIHFQCPRPTPPPDHCFTISKSANPPNGSEVAVSDVGRYGLITYTLSYNLSADPLCANRTAELVDVLPPDTELLPGSTSDGVTPDASRALRWEIEPGSSGEKRFTVVVLDSACTAGETIHNRARLIMPGRSPVESNEVKHLPKCAPVIGDNENPPYAQDELQVFPYPIIAGREHTVSVRLINRTATPQVATVNFQTSSQVFGIGIPFTTFATRAVTIPANGNVILSVPATFAVGGHYCIQVMIEIAGYGTIVSQRNLDVMEDLKPGVPDVLNFKVGNPLGFAADIALEVENTCPGFTAVVAPTLLSGMAPGEIRNATLTTTPPNPVVLGSGCHIDIRGYAVVGGSRIPLGSGLRKLDVPPIPATTPSGIAHWLSPYISFRDEPLAANAPNQICIELQNPLPVTKTVTLVYKVANFGAGIGFTPVGTRTVDLPPNSIAKYCIDWTPPAAGHYCVVVEVQISGWRTQYPQRNVDVQPNWRPHLTIPFVVRNQDLIPHNLRFRIQQWGIDPNIYQAVIRRVPQGDPAPDVIPPGGQVQLQLAFVPIVAAAASQTTADLTAGATFGDMQRVDVGVEMDGKEVSGVSVLFAPQTEQKVYLPLVTRR